MAESKNNPPPNRDHELAFMVQMVNRIRSLELPVTLIVGGTTISGRLIGISRYYEELGRLWKAGFANTPLSGFDPGASMQQHFTEVANAYDEAEREKQAKGKERADSADGDLDADLPNYLHLTAAQILQGRSMVPDGSMLARFRLSEIAGWSMGSLGTA